MFVHREWHSKQTDRTKVSFRSLVTLAVQLLVLDLRRALLACLLVLLAVDLLAVDAAVFDEEAGRAVLQLDAVVSFFAAVGADFSGFSGRVDWDTAHLDEGATG